MTTRLLPSVEWFRLAGTELDAVWPFLDPTNAHVLVVEDGDQIVACWLAFQQWHVEGLWIAEAHRKRGRVAGLLLDAMRTMLQGLGARTVMTASLSAEVTGLLEHLGAQRLPGEHYTMPVRES